MPKAYRSQPASVQKLIVIGQVYEPEPGPSCHPLDILTRWVDRQVDRVLPKLRPRKPRGPIYKPQHVSK